MVYLLHCACRAGSGVVVLVTDSGEADARPCDVCHWNARDICYVR